MAEVKASVSQTVLAERHMVKSDLRKNIFSEICSDDFLSSLCTEFMKLFTTNSSGPFKGKYAKLQLQWVQYVSGRLKDYVTAGRTMPDVSAVIHAIATAVFDYMCKMTTQLEVLFKMAVFN